MDTLPLTLTISSDQSSFALDTPIRVKVALRNVSSHPVVVNKRMGVGYEDGIIRELFFTVYDAASGQVIPVPDTERIDAHRMPPTKQDFQVLEPDEAAEASVDLTFWHPLKQAGDYRFTFFYDNEFDGQEFGLQAFTGTIESNPIEITLQ